MHDETDRWYSLRAAANKIGISVDVLRRQILAGRIKGARKSTSGHSQWLIPEATLEEFLVTGRFQDQWARPSEIAAMTGINVQAVRRMAEAGTWEILPRVGAYGAKGQLRIRRSSVEQWLEGGTGTGEAAS